MSRWFQQLQQELIRTIWVKVPTKLEMTTEEDSRIPFVHGRAGHVAVTWKELTLVWGGCEYGGTGNQYWDPAEVTIHFEVSFSSFDQVYRVRSLLKATYVLIIILRASG